MESKQPAQAKAGAKKPVRKSRAKHNPPSKGGRPQFDGKGEPEVVRKLEEAFSIGCPVTEACIYADISRSAFYEYVNARPGLLDRFEQLRDKPVLKARATVVAALHTPEVAKWYLERRRKDEFTSRQEHTGKDGGAIEMEVTTEEQAEVKRVLKLNNLK